MSVRLMGALGMCAAVVILCTGVLATTSSAATWPAGWRSCGSITGPPLQNVALGAHGRVSCAEARRIYRCYTVAFKACHGRFHGPLPGPRSKQYDTFAGGWRCTVIHGGTADCEKGKTGGFAFTQQASAPPPGPLQPSGKANAPCTAEALEAAMRNAGLTATIPTAPGQFGCEGDFAYALAEDHNGEMVYGITVLFRASAGQWAVVGRGEYCGKSIVPKAIEQPACSSN